MKGQASAKAKEFSERDTIAARVMLLVAVVGVHCPRQPPLNTSRFAWQGLVNDISTDNNDRPQSPRRAPTTSIGRLTHTGHWAIAHAGHWAATHAIRLRPHASGNYGCEQHAKPHP